MGKYRSIFVFILNFFFLVSVALIANKNHLYASLLCCKKKTSKRATSSQSALQDTKQLERQGELELQDMQQLERQGELELQEAKRLARQGGQQQGMRESLSEISFEGSTLPFWLVLLLHRELTLLLQQDPYNFEQLINTCQNKRAKLSAHALPVMERTGIITALALSPEGKLTRLMNEETCITPAGKKMILNFVKIHDKRSKVKYEILTSKEFVQRALTEGPAL